jgi:antitoxin component of MazEF toxin-antitoxin module
METHQYIGKWGNSLGLRIPAVMAESIGLRQGDDVRIWVEDNALIIKRGHISSLPVFDLEAACAEYANCDPIPKDIEPFLNAAPVGREIL